MQRSRRAWVASVVIAVVLGACAPLPGRTLDPVGRALGEGPAGPPPARDQWVGRWEDSRGAGEVTIQIRRTGPTLEGVWQIRTGGEGVLTGTQAAGTSVVKFQLASQGGPCFVLLEGAGEIKGNEWTATYSGRDCRGAVTDGRFALTRR